MKFVKRAFGRGGNDGEWNMRCLRHGFDPSRIFRSKSKNSSNVDILEETPKGFFRWTASMNYFTEVDPVFDKDLEDYG